MYPLLLVGAAGAFYPLSWTYNLAGAAVVALVVYISIRQAPPHTAVEQLPR